MSRGEAQQLELIGMTSVAEVSDSAVLQSRIALAVSDESAGAD